MRNFQRFIGVASIVIFVVLVAADFTGMVLAQTAPTKVQPVQISIPAGTSVWMNLAGVPTFMQLDAASFLIDTATSPPTLRILPAAQQLRVYDQVAIHQGGAAWKLPGTPLPTTLTCSRSGVRVIQGRDYTVVGDTITFVVAPNHPAPQPTENVACDYRQ